MSTTNFSNFITGNLLADLSNVDLISSVSDKKPLTVEDVTVQQHGRYFCIGDLLIQFSANTTVINNQNIGEYTVPFPIPYDSEPYTIMLTPTRNGSNNNSVNATLKTFSKSDFSVYISSSGGWTNFVAIGPRPASLYTA